MRRIVDVIAMVFSALLMGFSHSALSQYHDFPHYRYMEMTKDSEIYSWVGEHVIKVAVLKKGQAFKIIEEEAESDYYALHFGNGTGYIA
ncbi:polysaccharide deacetylase family protein, partial [Xenorhabdus sp. IM139775]|nr:polysaccharide deacetylase family protein [Xenorhabdus sp. IM139775]